MRNVTSQFKEDIRTYGRQLDFKIKVNEVEEDLDNFNSVKPSFNANLFKTIMQSVKIDSKNAVAKKSKIEISVGIKVNEPTYEYIKYNPYTVKSCIRNEDTNSYEIDAYDKMLDAMIDYDLELTTKLKVREYLIKICQRLGWDIKNIPATFINSEKLVDPTLHRDIGYTFRDALDEIATITCSALLFIEEEFYLLYPVETNENIDETYLDEDNITIGEKYFINSLVFSRAEESDNIYRKNADNIEINGLHEYRISDNQLLSTNDRDLYIDEMWNYLKTFGFYTFDVKSKGILFLEAYDRFNLKLSGNVYSVILLNNEISFDDGIEETLYMDAPKETETDYKCADNTDRRINQAYILVDKQNLKIEQLTNKSTEHEEKIAKAEQDIEGFKQNVGNIIDYKRNASGYTQLEVSDANAGNALNFEIQGNATYESNLFPFSSLYPSENIHLNQHLI